MISGCNGLVSSTFGTHRLREFSVAAASGGVGDTDYVRLTDGTFSEGQFAPVTDNGAKPYYFATVEPVNDQADSVTLPFRPVVWSNQPLPTDRMTPITATVERPPAAVREGLARQAALPAGQAYLYLHLDRRPLAWYWQASLFLGGLLLAAGTEWWNHARS